MSRRAKSACSSKAVAHQRAGQVERSVVGGAFAGAGPIEPIPTARSTSPSGRMSSCGGRLGGRTKMPDRTALATAARRRRLSAHAARSERAHRHARSARDADRSGGHRHGLHRRRSLEAAGRSRHSPGVGRWQRRHRRGRSTAGQAGLDDRHRGPNGRWAAGRGMSCWPTARSPPRATCFSTSLSTASAIRTSSIPRPGLA